VLLDCLEGRRAGGVARHHEQLGALADQMVCNLDRKRFQFGLGALAVREARGVPQVDIVLRRQRNEQLVQDGQSAHA
jgi:hypothetical protein